MRVLAFITLAGTAIASSKPPRKDPVRHAKIEARRRAADGNCGNVPLRCMKGKGKPSSKSTGCNCHDVYQTKAGKGEVLVGCVLMDKENAPEGLVYESGTTGLCREKMAPCHKRTVIDLFGSCGNAWDATTCFMDCQGPSCMPNYNGNKCMQRPDICKKFKNKKDKCDKYKRYTETGYSANSCCRRCYRKKEDIPCLLGYAAKNTEKKQGSQGVGTWDAPDRHMADAKTKLCCRLQMAEMAALNDNGGDFKAAMAAKTGKSGRIEQSLCYGKKCGNGHCDATNGECICNLGWMHSETGNCDYKSRVCLHAQTSDQMHEINSHNFSSNERTRWYWYDDEGEYIGSFMRIPNNEISFTNPKCRNSYGKRLDTLYFGPDGTDGWAVYGIYTMFLEFKWVNGEAVEVNSERTNWSLDTPDGPQKHFWVDRHNNWDMVNKKHTTFGYYGCGVEDSKCQLIED